MKHKEATEDMSHQDEMDDKIADEVTNEQNEKENSINDTSAPDNTAEQLATLQDSYLRLMAEFDNYRKRTLKEKADLIKNGGEKVLVGLLPVLDDFERAIDVISAANNLKAIEEGILLIYNKFISFLQQNGVKKIEAIHQEFNDEQYEAVALIPTTDENMKGKIMECIQTGYLLNEKVIRHAKVVVAE